MTEATGGATAPPTPDETGRDALQHLQRALLETIAAARSALDAAEALVREPSYLAGLAAAVSATADAIGTAVAEAFAGRSGPSSRRTGEPTDTGRTGEDGREARVHHIPVG